MWAIIVPHSMSIEQLSSVVRIVACVLQPQWQPVFIEALLDELWIASVGRRHIRDILGSISDCFAHTMRTHTVL